MNTNDDANRAPRRSRGPSVNAVHLLGNLAADPDVRYTAEGAPVVRMRLATHWQDRSDFHNLVAFGPQAEFASEYLSKGRLVYAEGRLQNREWTDRDGVKRYTTEVVANSVQALGPRPQREEVQHQQPEQEAER